MQNFSPRQRREYVPWGSSLCECVRLTIALLWGWVKYNSEGVLRMFFGAFLQVGFVGSAAKPYFLMSSCLNEFSCCLFWWFVCFCFFISLSFGFSNVFLFLLSAHLLDLLSLFPAGHVVHLCSSLSVSGGLMFEVSCFLVGGWFFASLLFCRQRLLFLRAVLCALEFCLNFDHSLWRLTPGFWSPPNILFLHWFELVINHFSACCFELRVKDDWVPCD